MLGRVRTDAEPRVTAGQSQEPEPGGSKAKPLSFSGTRQGDEANGKEDKSTLRERGPWWRTSTGRVGAGGMLTDGRWLWRRRRRQAWTSARYLHGVVDLPHGLSALRVGAGTWAGAIHRAGAGEGGCAGACQAGHAGRWHCTGTEKWPGCSAPSESQQGLSRHCVTQAKLPVPLPNANDPGHKLAACNAVTTALGWQGTAGQGWGALGQAAHRAHLPGVRPLGMKQ